MLRKRLDTRVLYLPFARSIGVLKALLIFAVKTLFSDRLSRLIIYFFPTAVFLNLLYLPSWRNHRTRRVHGGHLVEAREVDSRLRARSGAALTVPRSGIHFRPVRLPPHKKPPHTQGARRSFGGGEGSRTPVRRWVDRTFSGCRRLLEFSAVRHQSANAAPRYLFVCLASSKEKGKRTFITQFDARFCAVILAEGTGGINGRGTAVRLPMLLVC